mgnify:CR=1 FL=1
MRNSEADYIIQKVMDNLKQRFMEEEDNVVRAEKFFLVSSVVHDVVEKKFSGELDDEQCRAYFVYIEKFLKGEVEMFWEEGVVKVKRKTNYDEERKKALESLRVAYEKMLGTFDPDTNKQEE